VSFAAILVVVGLCAGGDISTAAETPSCKYDDKVWFEPTMQELEQCAKEADDKRANDEQAICEVVPMAATEPTATVTIGPLEFPSHTKVIF